MSMARQIAALQRLTVKDLRAKYAEVFGEATRANNRGWLLKRIRVVWDLDDAEHFKRAKVARDAILRQTGYDLLRRR